MGEADVRLPRLRRVHDRRPRHGTDAASTLGCAVLEHVLPFLVEAPGVSPSRGRLVADGLGWVSRWLGTVAWGPGRRLEWSPRWRSVPGPVRARF